MQQRCTALQQSLPGLSEAAGSFAAASSQLASRRAENKQLLSRSLQHLLKEACSRAGPSVSRQPEAVLNSSVASVQRRRSLPAAPK